MLEVIKFQTSITCVFKTVAKKNYSWSHGWKKFFSRTRNMKWIKIINFIRFKWPGPDRNKKSNKKQG